MEYYLNIYRDVLNQPDEPSGPFFNYTDCMDDIADWAGLVDYDHTIHFKNDTAKVLILHEDGEAWRLERMEEENLQNEHEASELSRIRNDH